MNEPVKKRPILRASILPDRIRSIDGQGFAFVPNRFLREGFLASLTADEIRLYFLLVLAGDRQGLSFYHYDTACSILEMIVDDYIVARNGLIEKDLVAYDGTRLQVLSLPAEPRPRAPIDVEKHVVREDEEAERREIRRAILASTRSSD